MSESPPNHFEATYYLKSANLELTRKCNLRCTYCSVSQPDYQGTTMCDEGVRSALEGLRRMKANSVALNGHGETTTLKGWQCISSAIRATGARVHLTSNFARPFSTEEIEELLVLTSVIVSMDTDDADLLKRVRRSVNLGTILDNLRRLRDTAVRRDVKGPVVIASCVVHTHNVMHLDRFVRFALRNGIRGFSFCNLIKNPPLPGALNVDHVTALPREELAAARRKLLEAKGIAFSKGASCEIQSGLIDSIEETLADSGVLAEATIQNKRRHFTEPKEGETRHCLDPWFFALMEADATVRPCCWHPAVGSLRQAPLEAIMNGEAIVSLRRQLLVGDLGDHCRTCPAKPAIGITEFEEIVHRDVPRNPMVGYVKRAGIFVKHAIRRSGYQSSSSPRKIAAAL